MGGIPMTERRHHGHQDALAAREELRALLLDADPPLHTMYYPHATEELADGPPLPRPARNEIARLWAMGLEPLIKDSDVFWVSDDMVRLVNTADHDLEQQIETGFRPEPLVPKVLLTDCGFAWFEQEVVLTGLNAEWSKRFDTIAFKALGWNIATVDGDSGLTITLFGDTTNDPDTMILRRALEASGAHLPTLVPLSSFHWRWGRHFDAAPERVAPVLARWLQAFWSICQEEVATKVHAQPPRHIRRRWEREKRDVPTITIITLRRPKQPRDEDIPLGEHRYSHRFLVRGHWRNQPYGKGRQERRLQYVHPYIKGPDSAPFIEKTRVFKVVR